MEGVSMAETMVLHVLRSSCLWTEEVCAPLLETQSRHHTRVTGHSSSDNKRNQCTSAHGHEQARTPRLGDNDVMNSSRLRSPGGGDRRFGLNSYSRQSFREGQLKRTQANSSEIAREISKRSGGVRSPGAAAAHAEDSGVPGLRSVTYIPDHEGAWSKSMTVTTLQLRAVLVGRTGGDGDGRAVAVDHPRGSTQAGVWAHDGLPVDRE